MLSKAETPELKRRAVENYKLLMAHYGFSNDGVDSMQYDDILYDCYMRIISNCPMGAELWVYCTTNYEQLATIYRQRKNHRLKEDWGEFCKFIESLPFAKELILNE